MSFSYQSTQSKQLNPTCHLRIRKSRKFLHFWLPLLRVSVSVTARKLIQFICPRPNDGCAAQLPLPVNGVCPIRQKPMLRPLFPIKIQFHLNVKDKIIGPATAINKKDRPMTGSLRLPLVHSISLQNGDHGRGPQRGTGAHL